MVQGILPSLFLFLLVYPRGVRGSPSTSWVSRGDRHRSWESFYNFPHPVHTWGLSVMILRFVDSFSLPSTGFDKLQNLILFYYLGSAAI